MSDAFPLIPGDVLFLTPEWVKNKNPKRWRQNYVSRLICTLDNSDVSHAALYCDCNEDGAYMIEAALPRMQMAPLPGPDERRHVYVHRYKDKNFNSLKVIDKAKTYLNNKEPHPVNTLIAAGLLLLVKRFIPDARYIKLAEEALRTLSCLLLKLYPGKNPMTCAQFTSLCYQDAGIALFPKMRERAPYKMSLAELTAMKLNAPNAAPPSWEKFLEALEIPLKLDPKGLENKFEEVCRIILIW